jgi:hypothetical protein
MLYLTISLACDIVAYKQVSIGNLISVGSAFIFPLLYVLSDTSTEVFGEKATRLVIWIHTGCDCVFTYLILYLIHLPSPSNWHLQDAYNQILDPMARLYVAGIIGSLGSSFININILSRWKVLTKGKFFWLRSIGSTSIGILSYTVLTDLIAFSKTFNTADLLQVTLLNIVSNISFAVIYTGIATFLVKFLKSRLCIDTYENTNFNPFKV